MLRNEVYRRAFLGESLKIFLKSVFVRDSITHRQGIFKSLAAYSRWRSCSEFLQDDLQSESNCHSGVLFLWSVVKLYLDLVVYLECETQFQYTLWMRNCLTAENSQVFLVLLVFFRCQGWQTLDAPISSFITSWIEGRFHIRSFCMLYPSIIHHIHDLFFSPTLYSRLYSTSYPCMGRVQGGPQLFRVWLDLLSSTWNRMLSILDWSCTFG